MDGGAWWAAVHGIAKSRMQLSDFTFIFHFHALEKEMATHSSVLAWRIPGTGILCVYGAAQSRTRLKRLRSSSSYIEMRNNSLNSRLFFSSKKWRHFYLKFPPNNKFHRKSFVRSSPRPCFSVLALVTFWVEYFFFPQDLFIDWLRWVFTAVRGLSLVVVCGLLLVVAALVTEHRLSAVPASAVVAWGPPDRCHSSCAPWLQLICSTWNLLEPGTKPASLALHVRFLTTEPPRKP